MTGSHQYVRTFRFVAVAKGTLLHELCIHQWHLRQTKVSRYFDASPEWDRSLLPVNTLTTLDSMAPAFVIKLQSTRFLVHPCTRVKTRRNRCKFKLVTKAKTNDVFEARDNIYHRTSTFSISHNNRASRYITETCEHRPKPKLSNYLLRT